MAASATVANWSSQVVYKYGDTVRHEGFVYVRTITAPVAGFPPYNGATGWYATDPNQPVPPVPSAITNFRQIGADWNATAQYGSVTMAWEGGLPSARFEFGTTPTYSTLSWSVDEDGSTAVIDGIGTTPGTVVTIGIRAVAEVGSPGNDVVVTIPNPPGVVTLGPPPAPVLTLVAFTIDQTTGLGSVALTFVEGQSVFNSAVSFQGYAVGGGNNYTFTYDRANGTAVFSGIEGVNNEPPIGYDVYMTAVNEVGVSPASNHLNGGFDPHPPLPTNATNFAIVSFLVGGASDTASTTWVINTAGNPIIGGYNCNSGVFDGRNPIPFLKQLQNTGVKVILSLGGATFDVALITNGAALANNIARAFFGAAVSGTWVPYGSTSSPAQLFNFDGLDLDWERLGPSSTSQLTTFVTTFRTVCPAEILSMSPQPPYTSPSAGLFARTAFNANGAYAPFPTAQSPVADYIPYSATPSLMDQNFLGFFDYIFVQYYNNPGWNPGDENFANNIAQWGKMIQSCNPRTRPSPPRIVIGLASADGNPIYDPADNQIISAALQNALIVLNAPSISYFCAGAGFWNSPSAQPAFLKIYDAANGINGLPSDVIFMWLNQQGIDPNWGILPILDDIEPGVPLPPLQFTTAIGGVGAIGSVNDYGSINITLTSPPAGLISIETRIAQLGSATDDGTNLLAAVPINNVDTATQTYSISQGLARGLYYLVEVVGLYPNGKTTPATAVVYYFNAAPFLQFTAAAPATSAEGLRGISFRGLSTPPVSVFNPNASSKALFSAYISTSLPPASPAFPTVFRIVPQEDIVLAGDLIAPPFLTPILTPPLQIVYVRNLPPGPVWIYVTVALQTLLGAATPGWIQI
jgi:hypothetical protein